MQHERRLADHLVHACVHALERLELAPGEGREGDPEVGGQARAPLDQARVGDLRFVVDAQHVDDVALVDVLAQRPDEVVEAC